jgi:phenylpropionate dioxygenase-like ring-hydroxylating dioxygenase large terminal subunit
LSDPHAPMPKLGGGGAAYLRNAWYAAGWADGLDVTPQAKVFLEEPVALFRDADGVAKAIGGRCPHRFAPLGHGTVVEGALQCPYHGLRFGGDGKCVFSPHPGGDVPQAGVAAYPLVERHALLWIWMGDAAKADRATIPDFGWLNDPAIEAVRGATLAEGHYELYSDNILDLSHAGFVHPALNANAWTRGKRKFWQEGNAVHAHYVQPNDYLSEGISAILGTAGKKQDFDGHVIWHAPATLSFDFRTGAPDTPFDKLCNMPSLHAFTPETAGTTHYLWATGRDFALGDAAFSAAMRGALEFAFEHEDMPLIRDAHRLMAGRDFWALRPLVLEGDGAGARARRQLRKMIAAERDNQHENARPV